MLKTTTEICEGERVEFPLRLSLRHGGEADVVVRAELAGPAGAPAVIVAGGISAGRHVISNRADPAPGWWQAQADAFAGHRLIAIDWLGADGALDRPIDAVDQAQAIVALLDWLGLGRVAGFVGASYGAMVGMAFAAMAPGRVGGLLAISGAHRAHPFASAQRALQRQAVALGERLGDGAAGVDLARKLAILTYRSPHEFKARFADPPRVANGRVAVAAEAYLDHQGGKHAAWMPAAAYRRLSESIDLHRLDPATIAVPATFVAVAGDALVPVADIETAAAAAPDARFLTIDSHFGHDAFLKEQAIVAAIISDFLPTLETKS